MKPHDVLGDDDRDRAALYALGALEADAAPLYEAHLTICPPCRAQVAATRAGMEALGRAPHPTDPPASLRERLLERIRSRGADAAAGPIQSWKRWRPNGPDETFVVVRGGEGGWESTAVPGVDVRRLFVDERNDRVTMLVRMAPGVEYPAHRHGGAEECYVLEGDLYGPDFAMTSGDYQRLEGGTVHGVQGTRGGCLLFIVSSMHDELLPRHA